MPSVHWECEPFRIRYHFSCLELCDLLRKWVFFKKYLMLQVLFSRARRRREGDGFQARRRRFMGIILTYRCIKQTCAQLFRKKQSILYPSFKYYPGAATDPFWEGHEALFFFRFRFRRQHFLQLMDEMEPSGKSFRCYTGKSSMAISLRMSSETDCKLL